MQKLKPYLLLVLIMMTWGFNVPLIKMLVTAFDPVTITALRIFTASTVVFLILWKMGRVHRPAKYHWKFIIGGGIFNVFFHHLFLGIGAANTSAVHTGVILGLGPILTAILSVVIFRHGLSVIRAVGFVVGTSGVFVTVLGGGDGLGAFSIGDLYIFISISAQALSFIIVSRAGRDIDPLLLTGWMQLLGSFGLLLTSLRIEPDGFASLAAMNGQLLFVFLLSAVVATAIGHLVYNFTITKIGPAETAIFLNLNTFFSIVGSAVVLGESIYYYHWLGLLLIVPGVIMGSGALEELIRRKRIRSSV